MCVWCHNVSFLIKSNSSGSNKGAPCVVIPEVGQGSVVGYGFKQSHLFCLFPLWPREVQVVGILGVRGQLQGNMEHELC